MKQRPRAAELTAERRPQVGDLAAERRAQVAERSAKRHPQTTEPLQLQHILALIDYDGTATEQECIEIVLRQLVGDAWRPLEDAVRRGEISHAEGLRRQIALVRQPPVDFLAALAAAAQPRRGLAAFLTTLAGGDGRAMIVSAGFRAAIEQVWQENALPPVSIIASELVADGDNSPPHVVFSDQLGDCPRCGPRSCKAAVLRAQRRLGDIVLVFGDGESDLCPAREADLVFARGHLAELCVAENLPWRPLDDFADVLPHVQQWLSERELSSP
ncbi:MAG: HAD-IB family phosphatase [Thermoleophilia bacterium]